MRRKETRVRIVLQGAGRTSIHFMNTFTAMKKALDFPGDMMICAMYMQTILKTKRERGLIEDSTLSKHASIFDRRGTIS